MRICIIQPVVPAYRTAVFNALGGREGVELSIWAGMSAPGAPNTDDVSRFSSFAFRAAPTRNIGPFLSQQAQLAAWRGHFDVIVYSWNTRYLQLPPALLLSQRSGVGTVVWGHGASPDDTEVRRRARALVGGLADAKLVYSPQIAADLRKRASQENVFLAVNAIDQAPIQAERARWMERPDAGRRFRDQNGLGESGLFVFLSRLRVAKRTELLFQAFARLVADGRDVRLAVIGDGTERQRLEAEAARLGIADRLHFLGAIYDEARIAPWCLSAIACVVPASIGLSVLHAFGYGLPVVTSDDDQTPEIEALRDGENGFLLPAGSIEALFGALRLLLDDTAKRDRMSECAHRTVTDGFTVERMVDGMMDAICFAAQARGRPA